MNLTFRITCKVCVFLRVISPSRYASSSFDRTGGPFSVLLSSPRPVTWTEKFMETETRASNTGQVPRHWTSLMMEVLMTHTPPCCSIKLKSLCLRKTYHHLNVGLVSGSVSQCFLPGVLWENIIISQFIVNSPVPTTWDYVSLLHFTRVISILSSQYLNPPSSHVSNMDSLMPSGDPCWYCHARHPRTLHSLCA